MRRTATTIVATGVLAASLTMTGCSDARGTAGSSGGGAPTQTSGPIKIAFSAGQLDDDFMSTLSDYMAKQVGAKDMQLIKVISAERSADKQVNDIQNLLALQPDVLVVHPTDSAAVTAGIKLANDAGIPVYTVDTPAQGGNVVADVRADNVQAGAASAELLVDQLKTAACWTASSCKVLELQGRLGSAAGDDRSKGAQQVLKAHPEISIISRPTDWDATKAADEAQNVVTSNKDLNGVTMASELMLPGVLTALKNANLGAAVGQPGHVVVTAIDGTPNALQLIKAGQVDGTVSQPLTTYVDALLDIIQKTRRDGQSVVAGSASYAGAAGTVVSTPSGPDFLLPAEKVTRSNVGDSQLWGNLAASGK